MAVWKPPDWYEKVTWKHPPIGKMPKLDYSNPPKTLDEWVDLVKREYFGVDVADLVGYTIRNKVVNKRALLHFCWACGDDNPLFLDPAYAAKTRYGGIIAPPTFPVSIRHPSTPECGPPKMPGGVDIMSYYSGVIIDNYDVIRLGDKFKVQKVHSDVVKKKGRTAGEFAILYAENAIWDQHGKLPCKMTGWSIRIVRTPAMERQEGGALLYQRDIQKYSGEELERIARDYTSEKRRGAETLYWEDVDEGDKLPPLVKGPFSLGDGWGLRFGESGKAFELAYYDMLQKLKPGEHGSASSPVTHPLTGWAPGGPEHEDILVCKRRAMPLPFDSGVFRSAMAYHMITNWMGDDGFLRRDVNYMRRPFYYADTMWWSGEIVKKYQTEEGCAVDIKYRATNQLGEVVTPGSATVLLPSRTKGGVSLPIPH